MKKYFIPRQIALLYLWVKQFRDTLPDYAVSLGLAPADVTALQASCDAILAKIDAAVAAEDALNSARQIGTAQLKQRLLLSQKQSVISNELSDIPNQSVRHSE